jgi:hypothetical protein
MAQLFFLSLFSVDLHRNRQSVYFVWPRLYFIYYLKWKFIYFLWSWLAFCDYHSWLNIYMKFMCLSSFGLMDVKIYSSHKCADFCRPYSKVTKGLHIHDDCSPAFVFFSEHCSITNLFYAFTIKPLQGSRKWFTRYVVCFFSFLLPRNTKKRRRQTGTKIKL